MLALLDADVNFKIAKEFTKRVQSKAIGQNVLTKFFLVINYCTNYLVDIASFQNGT